MAPVPGRLARLHYEPESVFCVWENGRMTMAPKLVIDVILPAHLQYNQSGPSVTVTGLAAEGSDQV